MGIRKGGWQVNVEYFDDHVIKTPKSEKETRELVTKHLTSMKRQEKIEEEIERMTKDWNESIRILKTKNIPEEHFGNPEFLAEGKIKQVRVKVLNEVFEELIAKGQIEEAKKIVDRVIDFIMMMWEYGIHEKTMKFGTEYGIINDSIMMLDFGEITDKREVVEKQLLRKDKRIEHMRKYYDDELLDYFQEEVIRRLTIEELDNRWERLNEGQV